MLGWLRGWLVPLQWHLKGVFKTEVKRQMFQELRDLSVDFQKMDTKKQLFSEKYIKCNVVSPFEVVYLSELVVEFSKHLY